MGSDPGSYEAPARSQRSPLLRRWIATYYADSAIEQPQPQHVTPRIPAAPRSAPPFTHHR